MAGHFPQKRDWHPIVPAKENGPPTWDESGQLPDFRVPVGRTARGRLVRASEASPGTTYTCPGCEAPLNLRKGEIRAAHFAHKCSGFCAPETALHWGVKAWIAGQFSRFLRRRKTQLPKVLASCRGMEGHGSGGFARPCMERAWFNLEDLNFDEVAIERETSAGLRPDVLLLKDGTPVLGIEVLVTHAVDEDKAARTQHPWIELAALKVIASPRAWKPEAGQFPWTGLCRRCQRLERIRAVEFSEHCDPGDIPAELAAEWFLEAFIPWHRDPKSRKYPTVTWRCPWCQKTNRRRLIREALRGASRASGLGPPIRPEVVIHLADHSDLILTFAMPRPSGSRNAVRLDETDRRPVLHCKPDTTNPLVLQLQGTSRPAAFLCRHCGGDCVGFFPQPWIPLPWIRTDY